MLHTYRLAIPNGQNWLAKASGWNDIAGDELLSIFQSTRHCGFDFLVPAVPHPRNLVDAVKSKVDSLDGGAMDIRSMDEQDP